MDVGVEDGINIRHIDWRADELAVRQLHAATLEVPYGDSFFRMLRESSRAATFVAEVPAQLSSAARLPPAPAGHAGMGVDGVRLLDLPEPPLVAGSATALVGFVSVMVNPESASAEPWLEVFESIGSLPGAAMAGISWLFSTLWGASGLGDGCAAPAGSRSAGSPSAHAAAAAATGAGRASERGAARTGGGAAAAASAPRRESRAAGGAVARGALSDAGSASGSAAGESDDQGHAGDEDDGYSDCGSSDGSSSDGSSSDSEAPGRDGSAVVDAASLGLPPQYVVYVMTLGVHPQFRRFGLARRLVRVALGYSHTVLGAEAAALHCLPSNAAAVRLYSGLKFRRVGIRSGYYSLGGTRHDADPPCGVGD
ncbi:hypothetical protein FNF29_03667 [Cafeteria roenbergensis]|uniref:N-alpha-acetyltransferase 60 n=1 Tax=Cafeteria roenbergensis TaxID=33653 RepID=A0A5A8E5X6_CAFRO|nr:hypothetical protein FNF29_03667 [Cafeteria roenbergensis]KAA0171470.1 hypothetical protein FNF28_00682 [Cafeteria roenbergensis]|eukprot:KAA0152780.1 hypothetical protein FNF29_03667 [Cafeteria roenbergensis]